MAAMVLAVANACVPRDSGSPAAATRTKKIGNTAVSTTAWSAETAQSYIAHARNSGRPRPSRSSHDLAAGVAVTPSSLVRCRCCLASLLTRAPGPPDYAHVSGLAHLCTPAACRLRRRSRARQGYGAGRRVATGGSITAGARLHLESFRGRFLRGPIRERHPVVHREPCVRRRTGARYPDRCRMERGREFTRSPRWSTDRRNRAHHRFPLRFHLCWMADGDTCI